MRKDNIVKRAKKKLFEKKYKHTVLFAWKETAVAYFWN